MGKTELEMDIIDKVTGLGHDVLLFSMQVAGIQVNEHMISAADSMPVSHLKAAGHFNNKGWARLSMVLNT